MAFTPIDSLAIQVGDPVTADLFAKIKANFDDHETRIGSVETSARKIPVFVYDLVNASSFATATGLIYYQSIDSFTLTNAEIRIYEKGSLTGSVEIDIKKSTTDMNSGSFTTIFTTKPKITYTFISDYFTSTNQVLNSGLTLISPGDILRLDITEAPTGGVLSKLKLIIYGEV